MSFSIVCGGILNDPAGGNFTSPGYLTSNYSNNLNCEWLIQNPTQINSSIVVILEDLHLENHQTCKFDYIEFRLGESQRWMCRFANRRIFTFVSKVTTHWGGFTDTDLSIAIENKDIYIFCI